MQRYLVFAGEDNEEEGGWYDFIGDAPSMDAARALARRYDSALECRAMWWHIVDGESGFMVLRDCEDPGTRSTAERLRRHLKQEQK